MRNIKSISIKLLHYILFKIENTYFHDESIIDNIDEYEIIVNIYKFILSNSIDLLINKESFTSSLLLYLSYMTEDIQLSSTDIAYLYEVVIGNIDKIVILKEGENSTCSVKGFNLNIQLGLSHQSFSNYNTPSLLLEIFHNDNKDGDLFEMSVDTAEKFVSKLKELYKNL